MESRSKSKNSRLSVQKDIVRRLSGSDLSLAGGGICTLTCVNASLCANHSCGATLCGGPSFGGCGFTNCTKGSAQTP